MQTDQPPKTVTKAYIDTIKGQTSEARIREWSKAMPYPTLVVKHQEEHILFPATRNLWMDSQRPSLLNAAAEEQLFALQTRPGVIDDSALYRYGCRQWETAYNVVTSCGPTNYNTRHDQVVYWLLRLILKSTRATEDIVKNWKIFYTQLTRYFVLNSITDQKIQQVLLINCIEETYKLLWNLCVPDDPSKAWVSKGSGTGI